MPEIQIFKFKNNQLRSMIDAHGEPWFVDDMPAAPQAMPLRQARTEVRR